MELVLGHPLWLGHEKMRKKGGEDGASNGGMVKTWNGIYRDSTCLDLFGICDPYQLLSGSWFPFFLTQFFNCLIPDESLGYSPMHEIPCVSLIGGSSHVDTGE